MNYNDLCELSEASLTLATVIATLLRHETERNGEQCRLKLNFEFTAV